nr:protein kinase-like domain, phloem protein 2-like protein [Tanacetum cinerariifolium]
MSRVVKKLERALDFQQKHESLEHSTIGALEETLSYQLKELLKPQTIVHGELCGTKGQAICCFLNFL